MLQKGVYVLVAEPVNPHGFLIESVAWGSGGRSAPGIVPIETAGRFRIATRTREQAAARRIGDPDSQNARDRLEVTNRRKSGPPWAAASRLSPPPRTRPVTPMNRVMGLLRLGGPRCPGLVDSGVTRNTAIDDQVVLHQSGSPGAFCARLLENPKEDEVKEADVKSRLKEALCRLLDGDQYLLENDLSERCIAARLAMYLREHFLDYNYDVDVEYNRQGDAVAAKRLRQLPEECKKRPNRKEDKIVVPDVIVHRRGCNSRNLLVIEMKKSSNPAGLDCDDKRIEAFCEQVGYSFGALVECETKTKPPTIRANWYSCQEWTDCFEALTSDDSVEQAEDGSCEQADQRPDHPL